jgi:hypothetical protein
MSWKWEYLDVHEQKMDFNREVWENFIVWKRREDNEYLVVFPVVMESDELKKRLREYPGLETSFDALKEGKPHEMTDEEFLDLFQRFMNRDQSLEFHKVRAPHPNIMEKEINGKKYILEFYGRDSGIVEIRPPEYVKDKKDFVTIFYGDMLRFQMNRYLSSILVASSREGFELADYLLFNLFGFKKPLTMRIAERIRNAYNKIRN